MGWEGIVGDGGDIWEVVRKEGEVGRMGDVVKDKGV